MKSPPESNPRFTWPWYHGCLKTEDSVAFSPSIQIVSAPAMAHVSHKAEIRRIFPDTDGVPGMLQAAETSRRPCPYSCIMRFIPLLLLTLLTCAAAERPNIVFLFSDDHALEAISAYGGRFKDIAPTPNIDRLAKEGAIFERSYCANSLCGPSRACILTGKHSHINGFRNNDSDRFDGSQPTFPKYLQKAGYQTAIIGKWHLGTMPTGFDHWEILPNQGSYYNPDFVEMDGSKKHVEGYVTDIITDKALDWLKNDRDKDKPFVLMCQHKAPHRNWVPLRATTISSTT